MRATVLSGFSYTVACVAIVVALLWGFGAQTAYPPTVEASRELIQQAPGSVRSLDGSEVAIDRSLLRRLILLAAVSRKECERLSNNELVFIVMLLLTAVVLLIQLSQNKKRDQRAHADAALAAERTKA